jgi:hypothetical protein
VAFSAALLLVSASAASAGPASSGATSFDYNDCFESGGGTLCVEGTTTSNFTIAPSGNMTNNYHNAGTYSYTAPGCSTSVESRNNTNYLLTPDEMKAYHFTDRSQTTLNCGGENLVCTVTWVGTIADGVLRLNRQNGGCTPA